MVWAQERRGGLVDGESEPVRVPRGGALPELRQLCWWRRPLRSVPECIRLGAAASRRRRPDGKPPALPAALSALGRAPSAGRCDAIRWRSCARSCSVVVRLFARGFPGRACVCPHVLIVCYEQQQAQPAHYQQQAFAQFYREQPVYQQPMTAYMPQVRTDMLRCRVCPA